MIDDTEVIASETPETSVPATEIVEAVRKAKKKPKAKAKPVKSKKGPVRRQAKAKTKPAKKPKREPGNTPIQLALAKKRAKRIADRAKGKKLRGPGGEPIVRRGDPKVAKRIKIARTEKGWTQRELAAKVGCGQPTVAIWEGAISGVGKKYAAKLGKLLGLSFE